MGRQRASSCSPPPSAAPRHLLLQRAGWTWRTGQHGRHAWCCATRPSRLTNQGSPKRACTRPYHVPCSWVGAPACTATVTGHSGLWLETVACTGERLRIGCRPAPWPAVWEQRCCCGLHPPAQPLHLSPRLPSLQHTGGHMLPPTSGSRLSMAASAALVLPFCTSESCTAGVCTRCARL